ncbi:MAG: flagellar biosynthesis anti-sigma factor FlgM [Candidatus Hydrogenedentes bacterium]|nr:flagellar biosynthesis anti-sigma factor FlgM [Candidatus Hydrogenedentota bacterium]
MAGIQGIVGLTTPVGSGPGGERPNRRNEIRTDSGQHDQVSISSEAKDAAEAARVAAAAAEQVRAKAIEEARESIEQGAYKLQAVVELVAARISPYLN